MGTALVGCFNPNGYRLNDMIGEPVGMDEQLVSAARGRDQSHRTDFVLHSALPPGSPRVA
jgi:hypothetical protein